MYFASLEVGTEPEVSGAPETMAWDSVAEGDGGGGEDCGPGAGAQPASIAAEAASRARNRAGERMAGD
jgi:hypothetical protein